jgi:glutathione S-transferase
MAAAAPADAPMVVGYHQIRGLGAPLRMMFFYKNQKFTNATYGSDMKEVWFGKKKPELLTKNACINLPYVIDGDVVITQSNTCLLYVGKKLGVDEPANFVRNHTVLDQTMDLRNDLMKIVYGCKKEEFAEKAKPHLEGSAKTNFTKLENFCQGPYMCGAKPQSGDFHVFEMLDQHQSICAKVGEPDIMEQFPKLKALHAAMKADPALAKYFAADCYLKYAQNNALFAAFIGQPDDFAYQPSSEELIEC